MALALGDQNVGNSGGPHSRLWAQRRLLKSSPFRSSRSCGLVGRTSYTWNTWWHIRNSRSSRMQQPKLISFRGQNATRVTLGFGTLAVALGGWACQAGTNRSEAPAAARGRCCSCTLCTWDVSSARFLGSFLERPNIEA